MTRVSNILLDKEILLESGTNELEMLVFTVADFTFGINVAKVREILPAMRITSLPRAHSSIRGVFKLRNQVIPCVSLLDHLNIQPTRSETETVMILADFNQQQTAFLVDEVERIHRLSWENILSVPGIMAMSNTPVTSMARCENRLIVMLDFEMIIDQVTDRFFRQDSVANPDNASRRPAWCRPTTPTARGGRHDARERLHQLRSSRTGRCLGGSAALKVGAEDVCDLLISDVEMPQVDGFHLPAHQGTPWFPTSPVMLYPRSSLLTIRKRVGPPCRRADLKPELQGRAWPTN
jgi:two-component system chemotaxis response regulator CheV